MPEGALILLAAVFSLSAGWAADRYRMAKRIAQQNQILNRQNEQLDVQVIHTGSLSMSALF